MLVDVNIDAAEKARKLLVEKYPNAKAIAVKADVSKEDDVKSAVEQTVKEFGRLDVMVCRVHPCVIIGIDEREYSLRA